jgi:chromate reductase
MKEGKIRIIGIAGSLRKGSYNKSILKAAKEACQEEAEIEIVEIGWLPLFNQDMEKNMPKDVLEFKEKVKKADAVLFVTPEYNYSVPGVLKNAIDWLSRPYGNNSLEGKPAGIMSAAIGMLGGARAQYHLRQSMVFLDMRPMNMPEFMVSFAGDKIDENGKLKDEETRQKLKDYMAAFIDWIKKQRA